MGKKETVTSCTFKSLVAFRFSEFDNMTESTVTLWEGGGREYVRGREVMRYQKIIKTQLNELMLTTFYLACYIGVKQK